MIAGKTAISNAEKRAVSLPREHAAHIDAQVASGAFASASEVVRASGSAGAESFTGEIVHFCMGQSLFPERGTRRDDLRPVLRVLGWRRRVSIALAVEPDAVAILGVFYGGQDGEGAFEAYGKRRIAQVRPSLHHS